MPPRFGHSDLEKIYAALQGAAPRGRELTEILARRNTTLRFAPIVGGFTLNFINTVFLQPLPARYAPDDFNYWATLLAHEACHVEQGFFVDSVEQEIRAYLAQCQVAVELGMVNHSFINALQQAVGNVNLAHAEELSAARQALSNLFGNQPATMFYNALPLAQPRGMAAIVAAAIELRVLASALFVKQT